MDVIEIHERAKALGLTGLEEMIKGDTIRTIQIYESGRGCYCDICQYECRENDCCWREDYHTLKSEELKRKWPSGNRWPLLFIRGRGT